MKALEQGAAGGFLQTSAAQVVRKLIESREEVIDVDRQSVLAFLAGGQASLYSPQSGQITGILKQIGDEMAGSLSDETAAEEAAIKAHGELTAAKSKEIAANTKAIEEKTVRAGEVAVNGVNMKADLKNTKEALEEDKAFLGVLEVCLHVDAVHGNFASAHSFLLDGLRVRSNFFRLRCSKFTMHLYGGLLRSGFV